ncbi:hypothetical protein [Priestia koreensis]|uniref:hypothetical protein n=1 Tax=Priestia koreensis TaxID=284581 RepID=UPI003457F626
MDALAGLLFLVAIILLVMTVIGAIKKNGKAKKRFIIAIICFVLAVIAIQFTDSGKEGHKKAAESKTEKNQKKSAKAENENNTVSNYKITQERLDKAGIWYLTIATPATKKDELKSLVKHFGKLAKEKKEKVSSIFVNIQKENGTSALIGKGKIALNSKGMAQTGVKKVDVVNFEYLPENIKDQAPVKTTQSNYTASDLLQAYKSANLAVPDDRDNTGKHCSELGCSQLITTEALSIYQWPTEKKAKEVQTKGFGDYQKGTIIIRFNDKNIDQQPYKQTLDKLVNGETELKNKKDPEESSIGIEDMKQEIQYSGLGADDKLVNLSFKNRELKAIIKLAKDNSVNPKDLAVSRYSQVSDALLKKQGWDTLTIEYTNVGTISMNRGEKETNEIGDYFPSLKIEKHLNSN